MGLACTCGTNANLMAALDALHVLVCRVILLNNILYTVDTVWYIHSIYVVRIFHVPCVIFSSYGIIGDAIAIWPVCPC
jgi:predicted PilT family ATPase